ncbi:MAG: 2-hydroxyacid dehydrogenase, partial [Deinococcus sp.]|nr:2-hydroxyacid dehydrogenase [Deinococcus sp.]
MRVLLPDLPAFRALALHDEHGVPGPDLDFYSTAHVPDGPADGVVLWMTGP